MSIFYCYRHQKKHEWSDWRGKPVETKKGIEIQHVCLDYAESHYPEFVPQSLHIERQKYLKSQIQSHRGGELSKEFVELYPEKTKQMEKAGVISEKEIASAKNVWQDLPGISHVAKTE